jgi:hypothetical protein
MSKPETIALLKVDEIGQGALFALRPLSPAEILALALHALNAPRKDCGCITCTRIAPVLDACRNELAEVAAKAEVALQ